MNIKQQQGSLTKTNYNLYTYFKVRDINEQLVR